MTGHMCSDGSAAGAWIKMMMMMMMIYDLSGLDTVICQHIEMAKAAATGQNLRLVYRETRYANTRTMRSKVLSSSKPRGCKPLTG